MTAAPVAWAPRAAWVQAAAAVGLAAGVTVVAAVRSPTLPGLVGYAGGVGSLVLALAVASGARVLIGIGLGGLVIASALSLVGSHGEVRMDAVLAGVGLLAVLELSHRSCESRRPARVAADVTAAELASYALVLSAAVAVPVVLLVLASGRPPGGTLTQSAGAAAVLGVVVVSVLLARARR